MKPDRTKNYIFTFLLFIVIFAETIATSACCNIWSPSLRIDLQNAFLSSAALTAPYLILPPKWRRSLWIALPLLTLILLTDTIFFRISGHFYWLSQISISTIFSSLVVKSGTAALRWTDIFIPLPMLLLVFPYASWRRCILSASFPGWLRWSSAAAMIIIPSFLFTLSVRRFHISRSGNGESVTWLDSFNHISMLTRTPLYKENLWRSGSAFFVAAHYLLELIPDNTKLSEAELAEAEKILTTTHPPISPQYAEAFAGNSNKNLLLIIVESLNNTIFSPYASKVDAAPFLTSLASDSGSVFCDKVLSQVAEGISADGQFILNTGLYPVTKSSWTPKIFRGRYPSLAKSLPGRFSAEAICEDEDFYSHDYTSRSYGYDKLYSNLAHGDKGVFHNSDTRLTDNVISIIPNLPRPFFLEITTLSMHSPYNEPSVDLTPLEDIAYTPDIDTRAINYLRAVRCFDNNLKRLIDYLKCSGLYDDTVIAIVGDHNAFDVYLPEELRSDFTSLLILNSGVTLNHDSPIGQIDIYPSLLDVMQSPGYAVRAESPAYRGLGRSIFSTQPPRGAINRYDSVAGEGVATDSLIHIRSVSEKMILSRYFGDIEFE